MSSIIFHNVQFSYDSPYVKIFDNLSLRIDTDWKTALIGRNGRGKTTFLHLLIQKITPTRGQIKIPPATSYFPYIPEHPQSSTFKVIKDSVAPFRLWERQMQELVTYTDEQSLQQYGDVAERYEQYGGYEIDALIHKEVKKIGLEADILSRSFSSLSGGEQTRALIVALFLRKGQFLLLDEPTNHLDMQGRTALTNYLATKQGFIVVSHDRYFLDTCVDHVISINRSDVRVIQGNYSTWKYQTDLENETEQRRNEKLKKEIRQLKRASRQRRDWSGRKEKSKAGAYDKGAIGHKAAKQMKRALTIERRMQENLEEKQRLFKNYEKDRPLKIQAAGKSPERLLRIQELTVSIEGNTILKNFSLTVDKGQRVAIIGKNGTGKTTLLNAICGTIAYDAGIIDMPGYLSILRAYQQPLWQSGFLRQHIRAHGVDETRFRQIFGVFGVEGEIFDRPLETFSQGQLKKVDLCRSFMSPAHLLLWDEPMNYIDILSREQIEQVILDYQPTLVFIEHDRYFVEKIATDIVMLDDTDVAQERVLHDHALSG